MSNTENSCVICFCDFDDNEVKYTCGNSTCNNFLCSECIEALIVFSEGSNLIPTCPNKNCNEIYLLSNIKGISSEGNKHYEDACFNYFLKTNSDTVKKRIEENGIIEKIRNERLKFIEQTFPKAITLVANLAFKDKMKQLDKQKRMIVSTKLKNANRSCLNTICSGHLDQDFICMKCATTFCKKCEKKTSQTDHVCKQEDLDSINLVNNMVHCPGCKLPIFKNEGCDSVTCASCNTNFVYSTGKIGGHGSHNAKVNVNITKQANISTLFAETVPNDCLSSILIIDSKEPIFKSKDMLLVPIKNYIVSNNKNKSTHAKDLVKRLEEYTVSKRENIRYHKYLDEIADLLVKKNFDKLKERLEEIIKEI